MTKIKICGISRQADASAASEAGADFIGLVFAESFRQVTLPQAKELIKAIRSQENPPKVVGVFANSRLAVVNQTTRALSLDHVQLSGNESDNYLRGVHAHVIRAVHLRPGHNSKPVLHALADRLDTLRTLGATPLLDTMADNQFGGTGQMFDHTFAQEFATERDFLLAGGLNQENVGGIITSIRPWGVDVSSGVETAQAKDQAKIQEFIHAVRAADAIRPTESSL